MTENIRNWLINAFQEPVGGLNETYYFDEKENQFFSIFITDNFLLSDDMGASIESPYSDLEFDKLKDRAKRIEEGDWSIIMLPRLTLAERIDLIKDFCEKNHDWLSTEMAEEVIAKENGRTDFGLIFMLDNETNEKWNSYKRGFIEDKAIEFCKQKKIDLGSATLFTDEKTTSMSFDLRTKQD